MYDTFIGEQYDAQGMRSIRQTSGAEKQNVSSDFSVLQVFNTQFFMLVALTIFLILNNNHVFYKSKMIFTINLIVMMFAFIYLSKYLDYDG